MGFSQTAAEWALRLFISSQPEQTGSPSRQGRSVIPSGLGLLEEPHLHGGLWACGS